MKGKMAVKVKGPVVVSPAPKPNGKLILDVLLDKLTKEEMDQFLEWMDGVMYPLEDMWIAFITRYPEYFNAEEKTNGRDE